MFIPEIRDNREDPWLSPAARCIGGGVVAVVVAGGGDGRMRFCDSLIVKWKPVGVDVVVVGAGGGS